MYSVLLTIHSLVRWLVLIGLLIAIYRAYRSWRGNEQFTKFDNAIRIAAVTTAHVQLLLGISLYRFTIHGKST